MERYLGRYSPYAFAILRIVSGLMFVCHGAQHALGMFPSKEHPGAAPLLSQMGVGGVIELVGGLLIAFGLLGSFAAFICSGQMAVAYFQFHFPKGALPVMTNGDAAVLYCFVFLYIAFHGSGILSVDQLLFRRPAATPDLR